ncbi:MAG TPA: ferredoxin family protein [Thermoanaerobaculia bacterium]|nr:ferredoxin family protein [Thermoanaerobaculia bacterium]
MTVVPTARQRTGKAGTGGGSRGSAEPGLRIVLYEGAESTPLEPERRLRIVAGLLEAGYQVTRVVAGGEVAPADQSPVLALGQFDRGRAPTAASAQGTQLRFLDVADLEPEQLLAAVAGVCEELEVSEPGGWTPWFPVIDYERCTNCMQCLSFCLFDVYGVDDDSKIQVQNQSNCKTNCPACSRVCPEAAIMFPKYKSGPINGDVVREEDLDRESMKVDISSLLGGDIYSALRNRQREARERFSTERDESRALLERKRCLAKLQKDLDIPSEVLMSLPSAGDIEERARRAREKRKQRLERSKSVQDQRRIAPSEDDWGI